MKFLYKRLLIATPVLFMSLLSGCATNYDAQHSMHHPMHHPNAKTMEAPATMNRSAGGTQMGMMDMQARCDMHKKMMSAKTPQEQQSMMGECAKMMPPEMMQKHMQMMQEQCK